MYPFNKSRSRWHLVRGLIMGFGALVLAGCSPFLNHYSGERWPKVKSAHVVMQAPSPDDVRWIGRSDFTSTRQLHDGDAIAAAKAVGADKVEWSDADDGKKLEWTSVPVAWNVWQGKAGFIPVPVVKEQFRYQARFYRSDSLGGDAISTGAGDAVSKTVPPAHTGETR